METRIKIIKYSLDAIIVTLFPVLIVCDVPLAIAMWSSIPCYFLSNIKEKLNKYGN